MILKRFKISALIFAACLGFFGCTQTATETAAQKTQPKIIVVKVPPPFDEKLSNEERYWKFQKFLFPQIELPKNFPKGLPNDDSLLYIALGEDKSIKINQSRICNLSEVELLQKELEEAFGQRTERGVFEPSSDRIVKAVLIVAPDSAKYGEVFQLIEAVEKSGADPIVLKIGMMPNVSIISPAS